MDRKIELIGNQDRWIMDIYIDRDYSKPGQMDIQIDVQKDRAYRKPGYMDRQIEFIENQDRWIDRQNLRKTGQIGRQKQHK